MIEDSLVETAKPAVILACSSTVRTMVTDPSSDFHILVPLADAGNTVQNLPPEAGDIRVLISDGSPIGADLLNALPCLGLIQMVGAGYDCVDPTLLRARGIQLANAGGANSNAVADQAMALALGFCCQIAPADAWVRAGNWISGGHYPLLTAFSSGRAGIVGLGHIGRAIARRLAGFDMETFWWGPRPKPEEKLPRANSLLALAEMSSLLFVACPGGAGTHHLIDAAVIEAVGPKGLIINVGRGSVIDEEALIVRLKDGRLGGAALDVFAPEPTSPERWVGVPNVLLSPHHGGGAFEAVDMMRQQVNQNIRRFIAGEAVQNRIF